MTKVTTLANAPLCIQLMARVNQRPLQNELTVIVIRMYKTSISFEYSGCFIALLQKSLFKLPLILKYFSNDILAVRNHWFLGWQFGNI
jgi:hypothetical protein